MVGQAVESLRVEEATRRTSDAWPYVRAGSVSVLAAEEFHALERTTFVLRQSEHVKAPLGGIVADLLAQAEPCRAGGEWPTRTVVTLFNKGALVLYHRGDLTRAENLCRHAIALFSARLAATRSASWAAWTLQPHINLGRLAAARGDSCTSADVFRGLLRLACSGDARDASWLPADALDSSDFADWVRGIGPQVRTAYLTESVKALLIVRDYAAALALLDAVDTDPAFTDSARARFAREARARVLANLHEYDHALSIVEALLDELDAADEERPGLYALVSDIHRNAGRGGQAEFALETLERQLGTQVEAGRSNVRVSRLAYALALRWYGLERPERAYRVLRRARVGLEAVGDQVATLLAHTLLCDIVHGLSANTGNTADWSAGDVRGELEALACATDYALERAISLLHLSRFSDPWCRVAMRDESLRLARSLEHADAQWWITRISQEVPPVQSALPGAARSGDAWVAPNPIPHLDSLYECLISLDASQMVA